MYRFHPRTLALAELVARGDVGEPRLLRSSFGFTVTDTANVRLSAELAGGALMDVGCYPVNAARMLGRPGRPGWPRRPVGTDRCGRDAGRHAGPRAAPLSQVSCSLASSHHHLVQLVGTEGVVDVPLAFTPPPDRPSVLLVTRRARAAGSRPRSASTR